MLVHSEADDQKELRDGRRYPQRSWSLKLSGNQSDSVPRLYVVGIERAEEDDGAVKSLA